MSGSMKASMVKKRTTCKKFAGIFINGFFGNAITF
jgi:hypothetical protein